MLTIQSVPSVELPMPTSSQPQSREALLRLQDDAWRLALRMTRNPADADDVVQEAYLRAVRFERAIPAGSEQRKWFLCVVANAARDVLTARKYRQRERDAAVGTEFQSQSHSTAPAAYEQKELLAATRRALEELDDKFRLPVSLHYEQGLTHAEAADVLRMPHATVRVYASRGLELLREKLTRRGLGLDGDRVASLLAMGLGVSAPSATTAALAHIVRTGALPAGKAALRGSLLSKGAATATSVKPLTIAAVAAVVLLSVHFGSSLMVNRRVTTAAAPPIHSPRETNGDESSIPKEPAAAIAGEASAELNAILDRKIAAHYHDCVWEALSDLAQRTRLRCENPLSLDNDVIALDAPEISVRDILNHLAKKSFDVEYAHDTVLLSKHARDETLNELKLKLASMDVRVRCTAVCDLASLSDKRACPLLFAALQDPDAGVRMWSVFSLVNYHGFIRFMHPDPDLGPRLLKNLPASTDAAYRRAVLELAGATADPRVEQPLLDLLNDPKSDENTRAAAATALGNFRSQAVVDAFFAHIPNAEARLRECIARAMARMCDDKLVAPAIQFYQHQVCYVTEASAIGLLSPDKLWPQLETMLSSDNVTAKQNAISIMAYLRSDGAPHTPEILFKLLHDSNDKVRFAAGWALWVGHFSGTSTRLIDELQQQHDFDVQSFLILALGYVREKAGADWLVEHLKSCDPKLAGFFARALAMSGDTRANDEIYRIAATGNAQAIMALSYLHTPRAQSAQLDHLKSGAAGRTTAADTLIFSRDPAAVDFLLTRLAGDKSVLTEYSILWATYYLSISDLETREKVRTAVDACVARLAPPLEKLAPPSGDF